MAVGKLRLSEGPLPAAFAAAFREMLEQCEGAAVDFERDPVEAVHRFRKSIRRARAVLAAARPSLPVREYRALRSELRDVARMTSTFRDRDVLPTVLGRLQVADPLVSASQAAQQQLVAQRPDPDAIADVLEAGVGRLSVLAHRFAVALPATFSEREVERGLRRSYRRARRRCKRAAASGRRKDFHAWRKATKELAYQLELLSGRGGSRVERACAELADLALELGKTTDLIVLDEALRRTDASEKSARKLAKAVRKQARRAMSAQLKRGSRWFEREPRSFARRLMRDLA